MMRRASIDLGTNTCLLLIAEWDAQRRQVTETVQDISNIVRLGQGVDQNRRLSDAAMDRALKCLRGYVEAVSASGVSPQETICVATSQARDSANGVEFFSRIERETGFRFQTISGNEEAQYTFLGGLLPGMDPKSSVVIDIGGGSTEFMGLSGGQSLDMGAVRFTERYFPSLSTASNVPVSDEQFWRCQEAIDQQLQKLSSWRSSLSDMVQLVAVAGTATTLAAWYLGLESFDAAKVDQVVLTRGDVHRMVEELKWRTISERRALPSMEAGREDVILAGAMILWRTLEVLNFPMCRVSSRGLRFGILSRS